MKLKPQVTQEHYRLEKYVTHERWHSYFNQVREALRDSPKNILVIGPGDGIVVNILKGYGIDVMTVDIDENHKPDVLASVDDLRSKMPDVQFDVVLCCQVLEHLPFESFEKCLESIKEFSCGKVIISLPEKSLRASLTLKPPIFRPIFLNLTIPFFWSKHKFDGEHYWEINSKGYSVKKIASVMAKHFRVIKYYRLKTNSYHFFFVLQKAVNKRVFLLSDGKNPHTIKWAKGLASEEIEVFIYSLASFDPAIYKAFPQIQCAHAGFEEKLNKSGEGAFKKIVYLKTLRDVKKYIADFSPDVIHAHFSSSYGLLGALSGFKPFFISVWGADVFDFPNKSFFHSLILKFNLSKATRIFSTSNVMAEETKKYTSKKIEIIPFGVDTSKFTPYGEKKDFFSSDCLVIGTIKTLEEKYGIRYLIEAFAVLRTKYPGRKLKLMLVGRGIQEAELKALVANLQIEEDVLFTGWVDVDEIPAYHRTLDIAVFPSLSESFGVAAVEASATGKPVVASNVGGLPEVVDDGKTGFIFEGKNVSSLVSALEKLILDPDLRNSFGIEGRSKVVSMYQWPVNVKQMILEYSEFQQ